MYTREILPPRASPIEDGCPVLGTWDRAFEKVDLLEIRKPYRYYLPRWIRNRLIKEWVSFCIQDEQFFLKVVFSNVKLYRAAQITLYDKKNNEKFFFKKIKPGTGWNLPNSLANSSLDSHSSNLYFRIHNWLDVDTVKLDINVEATSRRPSLTAHLSYNISRQDAVPMVVSLGITGHRIMYAYKACTPVRGEMVFNGQRISLKQDNCSGFFCDYKGFFSHRFESTICFAMGLDEKNRRFGFHIAENQASKANKSNENALWVNGLLTPLPPVLITIPNNPDGEWVIQDLEGMVDLTFTPKEQSFTNAESNAPLGYYNGMLVNSEGEQIQIKNLYGMGEKFNFRV